MKFILSYSCGKDSMLSLDRLIRQGHTPIALIVMYNDKMRRSWLHGVDDELLDEIGKALGIPLWKCESDQDRYRDVLLQAMKRGKSEGAEFVAFGDIDIQEHRDWYTSICAEAGLEGVFPLWQQGRENLVRETIALGYECLIKCIDNTLLDKNLLGRKLDNEVIQIMKDSGVDVCGENGEYHTLVVNGPMFKYPVPYEIKEQLDFNNLSVLNIVYKK